MIYVIQMIICIMLAVANLLVIPSAIEQEIYILGFLNFAVSILLLKAARVAYKHKEEEEGSDFI